jgi:hypothetical protein
MQEPLDLLNFMNGTGTQMPDVGNANPLIARRASNNIPIPSGITSLTFNKENNYGGGVEGIIPPNSYRPMPLPDLSFPTTPGIVEGLLPGSGLVAENFNVGDQPLPDISLSYEQAIARQGQRDVKSAEENARIQAAIAQGPGPTGAVMQKPNDVPAQTPTPPIINGTGTQMPEGGFPIPDIFAGRNPLSLPGSSGFEAQAFSSSIKPTGYQEGGFVSSKEGISGLMAMLAGNADKRPRNEGFFVGGDIPPDPYNIGDRGFLVEPPEDGLREMYPELSPEDIEAIRRVMFMRQQKLDAKRIDR